MKLDIKKIRELAKSVDEFNLEEITIESDGVKLTLKKEVEKAVQVVSAPQTQVEEIIEVEAPQAVETKAVEEPNLDAHEVVTSPMVGTFYKAPSPDADPFVKEGDKVNPGDTICIVEAMKMMNEVKADRAGTIVKILKNDGDPVKKGDKLFLID